MQRILDTSRIRKIMRRNQFGTKGAGLCPMEVYRLRQQLDGQKVLSGRVSDTTSFTFAKRELARSG